YIVAHYGTHVLVDIMLGATLNITYRSETRNSSRYSASAIGIKASVSHIFSVSINDSTSTSTNDINKNFNQTLSAVTHGGDPAQSVIATIPLDGSQVQPINITPWQNSCTDANAELVNIGQNGLIKLSDLIIDPTKKAALSAYIDTYLANGQVHLLPTIAYEFYNSTKGKHYYNIDQNNYQLYPGYAPNSQPFKVYATALVAGSAIPVYQFYNSATDDRRLTTNRNPGWAGYNYDGVLFYGNPTNVPGTVPVFEFDYRTPKTNGPGGRPIIGQWNEDHFYSTNRNANTGTSYTYTGQPFYVYPN
ncbi:MAG: hypothetical protein ABI113_03825, partial [Mucilaginibacter sp.]